MKTSAVRSALFGLWLLVAVDTVAQQSSAPYTFEWEVVAVDSIPGMTTARLYAKLVNPTDYLTSISGWDDMVGIIETTTSFYQDPDGWVTANDNNPLIFDLLPSLRYDSWVTIGIESMAVGLEGEIPVGLFPAETEYWVDEFESGGNLVMDIDGAWYVTLGGANGIAGEDLRVLVGQFTTDGVISGVLNLQVFSEGVASADFMDDVYAITIPTFDPALAVGLEESVSRGTWGICLEENGVLHRVESPCRWERLDATGRIVEAGMSPNGHFQTSGGGIVRVWPENGGAPLCRSIPLR